MVDSLYLGLTFTIAIPMLSPREEESHRLYNLSTARYRDPADALCLQPSADSYYIRSSDKYLLHKSNLHTSHLIIYWDLLVETEMFGNS